MPELLMLPPALPLERQTKKMGFDLSREALGVIARGGVISTRLALYPIILASWIDFEHANQR